MDKGHGRIEVRAAQSSELLGGWLQAWGFVNARQVIRVERVRRIRGKDTTEVEYDLSSLDRSRASAFDFLRWIRAHWLIENQLHHVRDVTFDEDHSRVRSGNAPQVMAALRNVAVHLLSRVDALSTRAATHRFQIHPHEALELLKSQQRVT